MKNKFTFPLLSALLLVSCSLTDKAVVLKSIQSDSCSHTFLSLEASTKVTHDLCGLSPRWQFEYNEFSVSSVDIDHSLLRFIFREGCEGDNECRYTVNRTDSGHTLTMTYRVNLSEGELVINIDESGRIKTDKEKIIDIPS